MLEGHAVLYALGNSMCACVLVQLQLNLVTVMIMAFPVRWGDYAI